MLNINASGKDIDFEVGMAQGTNGTANDIEKDVSLAFRDFVKEVKKSFGKNVVLSVNTNGNLDHGGGMIQFVVNVTNYPDGIADEEVVDGRRTNGKGEIVEGVENINKNKVTEGELVSQEEQDRLKKEREDAAKGQVSKDEAGNQVAGLKPAIAEIKK